MRLINYLKEDDLGNETDITSKKTIDKALSLEEPNGITNHTKETVEDYISLINYALSLQKKEVIKSEEDKVQMAKLKDLQDKLDKWNEYKTKVLNITDEPEEKNDKDTSGDDGSSDIDSELDKI